MRFDALMATALSLMVLGFFSDLWAHSHGRVETFFTVWHLALYSAAGLVFLILAITWARARRSGAAITDALPRGYGASFVGSMLFLVGGLLDMLWHLTFGIEANVSALFSPTHILLFAAGLLMVSGPLRAAWARHDGDEMPWRARLPMVVSLALVLTVLTAITQFIDPIVDPFAETTDAASPHADIDTMRADGTLQTRIVAIDGAHAFGPVWSPDGKRLAFTAGTERVGVRIANADGTDLHTVAALGDRDVFAGSWSPDGSMLAVAAKTESGGFAIELVDLASGRVTRLTSGEANDGRPMFSPDGGSIAFNSNPGGSYGVYVIRTDGTDQRRVTSADESWGASWSPDGRRLAFNSNATGPHEIYVANADGSDLRQVTRTASGGSFEPSWSPDGTRLAFAGERGAAHDIYVIGVDGSGETDLTRTPGRDEWAVSWGKDGTIAYTAEENLPSDLVPDVREKLGLASVLVQSALITGVLLLALIRGGLPLAAVATILGLNTALMSVLNDEYRLIPAAILAGVASDLVIRKMRPSAERPTALRVVAFFIPATYFALYLITLALGRGIGWPIHLWTGTVVIAGCVGLLLAYALTAPRPALRTSAP